MTILWRYAGNMADEVLHGEMKFQDFIGAL